MSDLSRFDGLTVDVHKARLTGTFDVDLADLHRLGMDNQVMLVVVARVKGASITEAASGDIKRTDTLAIRDVAIVGNQVMKDELSDALGLERPPEPLIIASSTPTAAAPTPPPATPVALPVASSSSTPAARDPHLAKFLAES